MDDSKCKSLEASEKVNAGSKLFTMAGLWIENMHLVEPSAAVMVVFQAIVQAECESAINMLQRI